MKRIVLVLVSVAVVLSAIILLAFVVSYPDGFFSRQVPGSLWESNLENFVSDVTFDNGKLFAIDHNGVVRCFDEFDGESVWNSSVSGHLIESTLTVYQSKVYVGTLGSVVKSLDEYLGEVQLEFQAPVSDIGWKSAPSFTVANGVVLASSGGGTYAYDVATGEVLWNSTFGTPLYWVYSYPQLFVPFGDGFFCVPTLTYFDSRNGSVIWELYGASNPPVLVEDKAILWNYDEAAYEDSRTKLLCVNVSGSTLWSFDVGYPMFQPTVYQDLVLFGAYDGNFYAVNLSNGALQWKTRVTNQNGQDFIDSELPHYPLAPVASPVRVSPQEGKVFWSFAFIQNGWGGKDEYTGVVCSLDVVDGDSVWVRSVEKNVSISSDSAGARFTSLGLAILNNDVFLTAGSDLWILDAATGNIAETLHFDHYILAPIFGDNKLFLAADLWLFAYS